MIVNNLFIINESLMNFIYFYFSSHLQVQPGPTYLPQQLLVIFPYVWLQLCWGERG
jgi:hypothetical protein